MLSAKRLVAHFLDIVFLAIILTFVQWAIFALASGFPLEYIDNALFFIWILSTISLPAWLYFIYFEKKIGQTLGKKIMKLRVVSKYNDMITLKQAIGRTFIKLIPWELSHLFFFLPFSWFGIKDYSKVNLLFIPVMLLIVIYIVFLFTKKNNLALHDYLFKTRVEKKI